MDDFDDHAQRINQTTVNLNTVVGQSNPTNNSSNEKSKKNRLKIKSDLSCSKITKLPNFLPQSFQDYVEKLSEKSALWHRKFIMVFLNLRKLIYFDKKPGKIYK